MNSAPINGATDNLISGWRLSVLMRMETPLCWLLRHGEFHPGPQRPEEDLPPEYAGWWPQRRTWRELGIDINEMPPGTMATEFGQVPLDGGKLLPFLIEYRKIVEAELSPDAERDRLAELYSRYPEYHREPPVDLEKYEAFEKLSLKAQCAQLGLPLLQLACERTASRWLHRGESFARPELLVQHEMRCRGYEAAACEGGPILLLLKSMCLPWFLEHHTLGPDDARLRLFEALCTIYGDRQEEIWTVAKNASKQKMLECFREIYQAQFTRSMYPGVTEKLLGGMFDNLQEKLGRIFDIFISDPDARAGWPDVTATKGSTVSFIEVKTKDRIHYNQFAVIECFAKPLALDFQVWQIVRLRPCQSNPNG